MKGIRSLSEAIILQSLEDLYSPEHRMEALNFFKGKSFDICASIVGLCSKDSEKIMDIVNKSKAVKHFSARHFRPKPIHSGVPVKHHAEHKVFPHNVRRETVCYP